MRGSFTRGENIKTKNERNGIRKKSGLQSWIVSHQGGLSSRWSLIRVVFHQGMRSCTNTQAGTVDKYVSTIPADTQLVS